MKNKKENWLLISAGISFILFVFFSIIFFDEDIVSSRSKIDVSLPVMVISAVLLAPIMEELSFRGIFTKKKWLQIISFAALPLFLFSNEINYWFLSVLILFYLLMLLNFAFKIHFLKQVAMFISALLFGIVHYQLTDFASFETAYYFLIQFALGLILIWFTINFNLLMAMIFHFSWNFIAMSFLIIYIQFPPEETETFENENLKVEWKRVPYFDDTSSSITKKENFLEVKSTDISKLKKLLKNLEIDLAEDEIFGSEPYMKYNMQLEFKDSVYKQPIIEFLEAEELIYSVPDTLSAETKTKKAD